MEAVSKLVKYKDIISYWKSFHDCEDEPFSAQLFDWGSFRDWQHQKRALCESQNNFSDYPRCVNERRRKYNLEGDADIRLDYTQQSGLDDWMEYQHFQLNKCERLEELFKKATEELDAAMKAVDEAGDSEFGDTVREFISHFSEDPDSSKAPRYLLSTKEPLEFALLWSKLRDARITNSYAEREVELLKAPSKVAESDVSKEISESDQNKVASAMKRWEETKKSVNEHELKEKLKDATRAFASIKKDLKWNKIMVDWMEQQKQLIAARR